MAHPIQTAFSKFQLTQEEQSSGETFTTNNLCVIQNIICAAAEEKLALKYNPEKPLEFVQREAELQGQIGILQFLVELSKAPKLVLDSTKP